MKYNYQWHELLIFEYFGSEVKQLWHDQFDDYFYCYFVTKIIFCLLRVFFSIDMLRCGSNPVIALQPINPVVEQDYFHQLKPLIKEQKLTRKRTVELCDGNIDIVVMKAKKAKSVPHTTEIAIDTFD